MTPEAKIDIEHFQSIGVTFQANFLNGSVGVIARYDLPHLYYPSDIPDERMKGIIERVNTMLSKTYNGCGYYGQCPNTDSAFPDSQVFTLFTDEVFYHDYKGSDRQY